MKIDKKWSIKVDSESCILVSAEEKISKKGNNIGQVYLHEDKYYYPNIHSCLVAYLNKELEPSKDAKDCVRLISETYEKINKNFKLQTL